jgi:hypothetical protein
MALGMWRDGVVEVRDRLSGDPELGDEGWQWRYADHGGGDRMGGGDFSPQVD